MKPIKAVALDVDGVLTDGTFIWGTDSKEYKCFSFRDVMGISLAQKSGILFALISGEASPLVDRFASKMGITDVFKGCKDKALALREFAKRHEFSLEEVCFIGDDVNDLPAFAISGLTATPGDAHPRTKQAAAYVAKAPGGRGAIREILDYLSVRQKQDLYTPEQFGYRDEARSIESRIQIKLSDYVMQFLVGKGVKHVFMLPGGGAMHLDDSLGRCDALEYTCFLHEQALAIAAESYGQFTNFPGVGIVTSGPGSTNAITGVTAAYQDSTPCLFISGQAKRPDLKGNSGVRQMGSQEVDIVAMVSPVTKYAITVLEPNQIRYHLEKAWHEATTGRMGPVWIDIPLDVQATQVEESHLQGFVPAAAPIDSSRLYASVDEIVTLLNTAERPVILAGNGVKLADAQDLFCRFAETNQIPILLTWKVVDFLDFDHPLNFGSPGIMGCRAANFIVQNSDLLLILGSRLDPSLTAFNADGFGRNAKRVMVDIDAAEIQKIGSVDVPVLADVGDFLRALDARQSDIRIRDHSLWLSYCRRLKERYPVVLDEYRRSDDNINLYVFTEMLFQQLSATDIITPESSGAAGEVTYQAMRVKKGQKIKNAAALGAMGFGLPYSIGACIANNRRRTILINGDGAFQLNIQELETVVRLRLPIKIFIFDNNGYGSIMAMQRNLFEGRYIGSEPGSGLTLPDISAIAKAYGLRFEEASSHMELPAAIARTLYGSDPVLCRIRVTQAHVTAPKVQAMKTPDGGMVSKPLEDMWPYLSSEELEANMIVKPHEGDNG